MNDTRTHAGPTTTGLVVGSYRILHELSSGGMGTVFRAEHVLLGRPAAVKLLRRDLSTSPALVQRLFNEARAVTACKHPGIVELYDFGYTDDGHAFLVMEYLEGESLGHRLARLRLAELEAVAIAQGIASALKAAHRVGVIHRDLKPDNVFLVPDLDGGADRTKVLDFGIAKLADAAPSIGTQTGALIGTPLYMAPEQARAAAAIDHRADLYSLGCILYHMLTGRPPFLADGAGEIIALQMFGEVVPPSQLAPVSHELDRLVLRLLEKDPARRLAGAGEVITALMRLDRRPTSRMTGAEGATDISTLRDGPAMWPGDEAAISAALQAAGASTTAQIPRRSSLPRIAGAIALLAVAAAGAMYATREASRPDEPRTPTVAPQPAPPRPPVEATHAVDLPTRAADEPEPTSPTPSETPAPPQPATPVAPARRRPTRKPDGGVGSITAPGGHVLPERTIEVHRGTRKVEPPKIGDHTSQGAPIEDTVDLDTKPGGAHRPPPSPPKDRSPP
jgi:eukaryotic-like serine/threonine-protein kinase